MNGDSKRDRQRDARVLQAGEECREAFREIVEGKRRGGEHAGLHEPGAAGIVKHGARLVRIDLFRHKAVDDRNDGNAQEERTHAQPRASALRVESRNELVHALRQNLHKGDVEHDAGGQAKGPRHELRPRVAVAHGDGGADRRG